MRQRWDALHAVVGLILIIVVSSIRFSLQRSIKYGTWRAATSVATFLGWGESRWEAMQACLALSFAIPTYALSEKHILMRWRDA